MANADDIKLKVEAESHFWEELIEEYNEHLDHEEPRTEGVFQDSDSPVYEPLISPPPVDANIFKGLGLEAEAMHKLIFGPEKNLEKEITEISERVEKLAKAARRTHMIATFKNRIKMTWHFFSTIPQIISAIWTTPPVTAEQALMNSAEGLAEFSRRCGCVAAFCTPSRNPLTGIWSLGE